MGHLRSSELDPVSNVYRGKIYSKKRKYGRLYLVLAEKSGYSELPNKASRKESPLYERQEGVRGIQNGAPVSAKILLCAFNEGLR